RYRLGGLPALYTIWRRATPFPCDPFPVFQEPRPTKFSRDPTPDERERIPTVLYCLNWLP
ncbi:MAG TPA: hypothetical protein VF020_19435, partial [Chthoniobacterales bacterium]